MTGITITFDTLAYVKELETAGIPAPHAEAQARALSAVLKKVEDSRELVTKADLETAKSEIIRWTASMFVAQTALLIGALFAMMKMTQPAAPTPYPAPPAAQMQMMPAVPYTQPAPVAR
ncbi:MAG: CCDC90 family protein [Magnetococcus sp. YQC-9]